MDKSYAKIVILQIIRKHIEATTKRITDFKSPYILVSNCQDNAIDCYIYIVDNSIIIEHKQYKFIEKLFRVIAKEIPISDPELLDKITQVFEEFNTSG